MDLADNMKNSDHTDNQTNETVKRTDEEVQKSKRDFGLGIYGSKKNISLKLMDGLIAGMIVVVILCVFFFSRNSGFRVRFNTDGGEPQVEDLKVKYDDKIPEPPEPHKKGYEFKGWYLSNGYHWDFETDTVGNDMELKAYYELSDEVLEQIDKLEE